MKGDVVVGLSKIYIARFIQRRLSFTAVDSVPAFRVKLGTNDLNCVDVPLNPTHSFYLLERQGNKMRKLGRGINRHIATIIQSTLSQVVGSCHKNAGRQISKKQKKLLAGPLREADGHTQPGMKQTCTTDMDTEWKHMLGRYVGELHCPICFAQDGPMLHAYDIQNFLLDFEQVVNIIKGSCQPTTTSYYCPVVTMSLACNYGSSC